MSGLVEHSCIITPASELSLLGCVVLVEVYERNLVSQRYILRKRKDIFIAFSDNCGYFLHQHSNSVSGIFLKVNCNVESETYQ